MLRTPVGRLYYGITQAVQHLRKMARLSCRKAGCAHRCMSCSGAACMQARSSIVPAIMDASPVRGGEHVALIGAAFLAP